MKLIKTYAGSKELKVWHYDHTDELKFVENFKYINQSISIRLCEYLKASHQKVIIEECYDSQSEWYGQHFYIDKEDLSVNGYCFSSSSVELFLEQKGY